jgi:putative FmdB family regulatory protein
MPTYDYVCEACNHHFEEFQSIKADALKECPECHRKKLRRLIGPGGGLIFKGSGFYCTDYRSPTYSKAAAADNGGSGNGSSSTSTDSKGKTTSAGKTKSKNDSAAKSGGD